MSKPHSLYRLTVRYFGLVMLVMFATMSILGTGGGNGEQARAPVVYTGLTTQAQITLDNALTLGEVAFLGVSAGTSITVIGADIDHQAEIHTTSIITIARVLHSVMSDIDVNSTFNSIPVGWVTNVNLEGTCDGTVSGSEEINETTETFTGRLVFNDFCILNIYMDGTITYNGTCDPVTFNIGTQTCDPIEYTMNFTTFNTRGYGESETITGTIATTITSSNSYETTLNLLVRDDNANLTYKYENYVIAVTEDSPTPGTDTVVVTGKVYHPNHGYVDVTTPTAAQFSNGLDNPPELGVMVLTGADGGSGPTTATFTFGLNTFTLQVDTDGDGTPEYSYSCDWATLTCS